MLYLIAFVVWCVLAIFTTNNRHLRDHLYAPRFGRVPTDVAAVALQVAAVFAVTWLFLTSVAAPYEAVQLWTIGVGWVVLSLLFDFVVVPLVGHATWGLLWEEYDPRRGGLWAVVTLSLLLAPPLVGATLQR